MIPVVVCAKVCKDPDCRAHGPMVRRIQRLQRAIKSERSYVVDVERALEVNSAEVNRLRKSLARTWTLMLDLMLVDQLEDGTSLLEYVLQTNPNLKRRLAAALDRETT